MAADPEIRNGVFNGDWQNVDYLVMTPGLEDAFRASDDQLALDALKNAHLVKDWQSDGASISLWKVDHPGSTEDRLLAGTAQTMVERFEPAAAWRLPGRRRLGPVRDSGVRPPAGCVVK